MPFARDSSALAVAAAMQLYDTAGSFQVQSHSAPGLFDARQELGILESRILAWKDSHAKAPGPAAEHAGEFALAWYNLGCAALAAFTEDDRRVNLFQKAIDLNPGHVLSRLNRAFSMNYSAAASPEDIFAAHRETGRWLEDSSANRRISPSHPERQSQASHCLPVIGLQSHSVAHFILPVLECHDRKKI
jgi:hypothetical protein